METTLQIESIEQKTSKNGKKYWKVKTDEYGTITCFEKDVVKKLIETGDESITCEIVESNGYKNIRAISKNQMPKVNKPTNDVISKSCKTKYPKCSREKLAEGLCRQAVDLYTSPIDPKEDPKSLNDCVNIIFTAYKSLLSEVSKE